MAVKRQHRRSKSNRGGRAVNGYCDGQTATATVGRSKDNGDGRPIERPVQVPRQFACLRAKLVDRPPFVGTEISEPLSDVKPVRDFRKRSNADVEKTPELVPATFRGSFHNVGSGTECRPSQLGC